MLTWLAQMGPSPRGGAYTYDWIENLLGPNMPSTDHVLPEYQHPEVGDTIGFGANRMRLERVEPERARVALCGQQLGVELRAEGSPRRVSGPIARALAQSADLDVAPARAMPE